MGKFCHFVMELSAYYKMVGYRRFTFLFDNDRKVAGIPVPEHISVTGISNEESSDFKYSALLQIAHGQMCIESICYIILHQLTIHFSSGI